MVRDAQPARLRELVVALEEVEPGFCFTDEAAAIGEVAPGSLVLLALRRDALDRLNLNRPVFAERSLRVVLWAEGELAVQLKFLAPDLHDWVSHIVGCPPGVPEFAVEGLAQGLRWWPGVAWTGAGLELAMRRVAGLDDCVRLDPSQDYSEIVAALEGDKQRCVVWRNIETSMQLWRVRWALAEARHTGPSILDNPQIGAPGWYRVRSELLGLREAASVIPGDDRCRRAALAELEPCAIAAMAGEGPSEANGPTYFEPFGVMYSIEDFLRSDGPDKEWATRRAARLGQRDIAARWQARWNLDIDIDDISTTPLSLEIVDLPDLAARGESPRAAALGLFAEGGVAETCSTPGTTAFRLLALDENSGARRHEDFHHGLLAEFAIISRLRTRDGWKVRSTWPGIIVQAMVLGEHASIELPEFLARVHDLAAEQLGASDPQYMFLARLLGLAAGAYANPELALTYLGEPAQIAEQRRYPLLTGADLELSVVLTMLGRYASALTQFARACANDPDPAFERFHQLTRAAQGQPTLDHSAEQPLSTRVDVEGRALLRKRLLELGNIADDP